MPLLNLSDIFAPLRAQLSAPTTPTHYLYLLGTDTKFTNTPTTITKDYQRGETLSYTALAITALLNETPLTLQKDKNCPWDALSYCAPSVDVLDGADTMGNDVGKRIAQAIYLALRAVSNGKTVLQITGHSRGAVESILLMHELFRIKKALSDSSEKSLLAVLKESKCKMTSDAIGIMFSKPISSDDTLENRMLLKGRFDSLVIHSFLIDPVPGGGVIQNWDDPRFYQPLPEFCKHGEYLICEDERSNYFEPIIPPGVTPNIVPGHHGTASGNRYTQQMGEITASDWSPTYTTNVQDLVLLKFFWFIGQSNQAFLVPSNPLALGHAALDTVVNDYLKLPSLRERQASLLEYYNKIATHKHHYKVLRTTGYRLVGIRQHPDGSRFVCTNARTAFKSLSSVTQVMPRMVNIEHVKLSLDQILPNSSLREEGVDGMIALITNALSSLGQSVTQGQANELTHALETELGRSAFFESISILVDSISQKYLNNNLTREEKAKLMDGVKIPFNQFKAIRQFPLSENDSQLLLTFESILKNRINQTMDRRYNALFSEENELYAQVHLFLEPPAKFTEMLDDLKAKAVYQELPESIKMAIDALNPLSVLGLLQVLSQLTEGDATAILTLSNDDTFTQLQQYFDAYRYDADQYLLKIQQVHDEISSLEKTYPVFASLAGETERAIKVKQHQLMLLIQNMERLAGTLLKDKNYDLSQKPTLIAQDFFDAAKQQAIALGAVSPEFTKQQMDHFENIEKMQFDHDQQIRIVQQDGVKVDESARREMLATLQDASFESLRMQRMCDQQLQRAFLADDAARREQLSVFQESSFELLTAHRTSDQQLLQATFMSQQESILETETALRENVVAIQESALELLKAQQTITQFQQVIVTSQQERLLGEEAALRDSGLQLEQIQRESILQKETLRLENLKNCRERDQMIANLNSDSEIKAASLIQSKLTPLTETYMRHLDEKLLNSPLDARIINKQSIVKKLMDHLKNDKVLPSERLRLFREELTQSNTALTAHRCPDWVHFVKKCLNVLVILATLVIPVMAYSRATGQSPLFFSQSKGERYSKVCTHQLS